MSRVFIAGLCPLPFEDTTKSFGPGIRTWQLARGIASGGHEVSVLAMMIPGCYDGAAVTRTETVEGIRIERVTEAEFQDSEAIRRRIDTYQADAVVGATIYGSHALVRSGTDLPLWADQFGHVMAEAQAKAALDGHNEVLPYFWKMVKAVDARADRFSAVSERQRLALIGELGALGRLTAATCGFEFVSVIPCAVVPDPASSVSPVPIKGQLVPEDAFVVLWSGSYNVWSDVETVFRGLEAAMAEDSRVHFVSTGGAIPGHDVKTYRELQDRIEASRFCDRFHLQGWIPASEVPGYWSAADLGVLAERPIYEGVLGSKNRIIQWLGWGLPTAYNRVGDLGDLLHDEGLGLTFEVGDWERLAERILWAARTPEDLVDLASRARRHALEELSFERTTEALRAWGTAPSRAPGELTDTGDPADHESLSQAVRSRLAQRPALRRSRWLRRLWRTLRRES